MGGRNKIRVESADILFHRISSQDDEKAFRALFYDYFAPLCVFAHRYIEEMDSCEDIVQEVFFPCVEKQKRTFYRNINPKFSGYQCAQCLSGFSPEKRCGKKMDGE